MRRVVAAALAVGMLGLGAPGASADATGHVTGGCRLAGANNETVTGNSTYEGVAHGVLVGNPGENLSVRCAIRVSGTVRVATPWGSGTTVASSIGRVTFVRTLVQTVDVCMQWTDSHGNGEFCVPTNSTQFPPQEVYDAVDSVVDTQQDLLGAPGRIVITDMDNDPAFTLSGSLDSGDWSCEFDPGQAPRVSVLCTSLLIDGPDCEHLSASATAYPDLFGLSAGDGVARGSAACVGDVLSERLDTDVAAWPSSPVRTADRPGVARNVTAVMCSADDGADGAPHPTYLVECEFEL